MRKVNKLWKQQQQQQQPKLTRWSKTTANVHLIVHRSHRRKWMCFEMNRNWKASDFTLVLNFINKIDRDIFLALFWMVCVCARGRYRCPKYWRRTKKKQHTPNLARRCALFSSSSTIFFLLWIARMVSIIEAIGMYHAGVSFPFRWFVLVFGCFFFAVFLSRSPLKLSVNVKNVR